MTTAVLAHETRASHWSVPPELWPAPVTRSMDVAHFNAVANDPSVRPFLGGEGPIDLTAALLNVMNVAIATPHGGFVLFNHGDGRYEVHSLFLPDGRGKEAYDTMRDATHYLFAATDCVEILTKVATTNRAAAALALRGGFEIRFDGQVRWTDSEWVAHQFYGLTVERWYLRSPDTLHLGEWFHDAIDRVKQVYGSTLSDHSQGDERAHFHAVGAVMLLLRAGNARKAEALYNRWAAFTGYAPMRVLADHPVVLDLGGVVISPSPDGMDVLLCQ